MYLVRLQVQSHSYIFAMNGKGKSLINPLGNLTWSQLHCHLLFSTSAQSLYQIYIRMF